MDRWKYYGITHRNHLVCNPTSEAKLSELVQLLAPSSASAVLDIGCGKAELLCRLAERYDVRCVGVDRSPVEVEAARRRVTQRGLDGRIQIMEGDGAEYQADDESFTVTVCLGASWIWNGARGTLDALARWTRPGGMVVLGEPYWRSTPPAEYLEAAGMDAALFASHRGNVHIGQDAGLLPLYTLVSSEDDWDRYQGLQWHAAELYALEAPDDPDLPEILERARAAGDLYLRWEREILGWAIYMFLKPG